MSFFFKDFFNIQFFGEKFRVTKEMTYFKDKPKTLRNN